MAKTPGKYILEMVRDFYASYTATVKNAFPPLAKALSQTPLLITLVWGILVDLSEATICCFIYGPTYLQPINTAKYDYRMGVM
ncbi:hypothetical protein R3W88_016432 [Solanum pinnatisectum]|uniref:Uncharacterized protein n=1 Tax=Solanum pinnatisectum TaxID=50273 RepID=A0AAV9KXS5_9SOLN|nr:hypothetical protein R3W88_016432 [Solanum pinnatisectum]